MDKFDFNHIATCHFLATERLAKRVQTDLFEKVCHPRHEFVDGGIKFQVDHEDAVEWFKEFIPTVPPIDGDRGVYSFSANPVTPWAYLKTRCPILELGRDTPAIRFVDGLKRENKRTIPQDTPITAWCVELNSQGDKPYCLMVVKLHHDISDKIVRDLGGKLWLGMYELHFEPTTPSLNSLPESFKKLFEPAAPATEQPKDKETEQPDEQTTTDRQTEQKQEQMQTETVTETEQPKPQREKRDRKDKQTEKDKQTRPGDWQLDELYTDIEQACDQDMTETDKTDQGVN